MPVKFKMKLTKVGNSLRMVIPKEIVDALKLKPGDTVEVSLTDNQVLVEKPSSKLLKP